MATLKLSFVSVLCIGTMLIGTLGPDLSLLAAGPVPTNGSPSAEDVNDTLNQMKQHVGTEALVRELISILGPMGALVYFMMHTMNKTIPAKDEALAKERDVYITEMRAKREQYLADNQKEREAHAKIVESLIEEIKQQREAVLEIVRKCAAVRESLGGRPNG